MILITFFIIGLAATYAHPEVNPDQKGICRCALAEDDKLAENNKLMFLINVPMDGLKEKEDCKNMCNYLVLNKISSIAEFACRTSTLMFMNLTKISSGEFFMLPTYRICDHEMKPSILYQQSDDNKWEDSGVSLGRICCHNGYPNPCEATNELDYWTLLRPNADDE